MLVQNELLNGASAPRSFEQRWVLGPPSEGLGQLVQASERELSTDHPGQLTPNPLIPAGGRYTPAVPARPAALHCVVSVPRRLPPQAQPPAGASRWLLSGDLHTWRITRRHVSLLE